MNNNDFNTDLMKERLTALKYINTNDRQEKEQIKGEIRYIESILQAEEFSGLDIKN